VKENIDEAKKMREKLKKNREDYKETRKTGYIKNYKAVRHEEARKYKKAQLEILIRRILKDLIYLQKLWIQILTIVLTTTGTLAVQQITDQDGFTHVGMKT